MNTKFNNDLFYLCHPAGQLKELNHLADLGELEEKQKRDNMNEFKARVIHILNVAINAKCTDRDEKIFFGAIIKKISTLDPNTVNIPLTVIRYLGYVKESPAIIVLKRDLTELLNTSHF